MKDFIKDGLAPREVQVINAVTTVGKTLFDIAKEISELGLANAGTPKAKEKKASGIGIDNSDLLKETGLRVIHLNPKMGSYDGPNHNGMTIAFRVTGRNSNTIEIATAVNHPKDSFTKKIGTKLAVERFKSGRTVHVPNICNNAVETIQYMFGLV